MVNPVHLHGVKGVLEAPKAVPRTPPRPENFAKVLQSAVAAQRPVKFSAHAGQRLAQRAITLDGPALERIANALNLAAQKGARESLLLIDGLAMVVNVPSRTVITVMDPQEAGTAVFTNIDSAIVAGNLSPAESETEVGPDPVWGGPAPLTD